MTIQFKINFTGLPFAACFTGTEKSANEIRAMDGISSATLIGNQDRPRTLTAYMDKDDYPIVMQQNDWVLCWYDDAGAIVKYMILPDRYFHHLFCDKVQFRGDVANSAWKELS